MSDDADEEESNPFDDLGEVDLNDGGPITDETIEESEDNTDMATDTQPTDTSVGTDTSGSTSSDPTPSTTTQSSGTDTTRGPELSDSSPPFSYKQADQDQLYLRDGLSAELDDHKYDAEIELRREFDVRNVEKREIDTAIAQLALEQFSPGEIAEKVVEARGFDPRD